MESETSDSIPLDRNPDARKEAEAFATPEEKRKHLHNQDLQLDIDEKKKYATTTRYITCTWIAFVMISTVAQFVLGAFKIGLNRYEFIALITTTTGSIFGFWLVVGRYLFRGGR